MALRPARQLPEGRRAAAGPDLYEAFVACAGLPEAPDARLDALAALYRDHDGRPARARWLHEVAERLVDHDEGIALWRHHHVLMAAREIGSRPGTGGSPGVPYLRTTLDSRFFPSCGRRCAVATLTRAATPAGARGPPVDANMCSH